MSEPRERRRLRRWAVVLIALALLLGCTSDPPAPATPTSTAAVVPVPPLPTPPVDPRSPGVYLVVQPGWSVADYQRIRDGVSERPGSDALQAFLYDFVRRLAEDIAAAARDAGYHDAEVSYLWPPPWCETDGACPSYDPTLWQVILSGPFPDPPAALVDVSHRDRTHEEYDEASAYRDRMLANSFTRPFTGPDFAVVPADREDRETHRYTPSVQTVWFG